MEYKPSVVVVSSSNIKPKSLIKLITNATTIYDDNDPDKIQHPWQIKTKYYTANISFFGLTENYNRTQEFNENVEALIIHMDTNKKTGLEDLKKWENIDRDCNPEVKLLISNYCNSDTKVSKAQATEWCLKRGFEFIELYPDKHSIVDEDDIIKEKVGADRIVEALQTHVWPNLILKEKHKIASNAAIECNNSKPNLETKSNENSIEEFLTNEGADDFTELFSQLHMMKQSIQSMPTSQRKQCAEQMVTAFWQAIGGDEEEVADL